MAVTIKDIARICNVSITTVSRVLNNKSEGIGEKTRELIQKTIKELNYQPNALARSMITKKTQSAGLVIPDIRNPFFSELARGAEDTLNKKGYNCILCNTDGDIQKEEEYIRLLRERFADGILFTTQNNMEFNTIFSVFLKEKYPFVFIERYVDVLPEVPGVYIDNVQGAYDITAFLIEKGHRHIACITGPLTTKNANLRVEGYKKALGSHHIPIDDTLIIEGDYHIAGGYNGTRQLLNSGTEFTSLFASNDLMALGAYQALEEAGKRIPEDVSLAGFDNTPFPEVFRPRITTVEIPAYHMGEISANMLLTTIKGKELKENRIVLKLQLVDKGSIQDIG